MPSSRARPGISARVESLRCYRVYRGYRGAIGFIGLTGGGYRVHSAYRAGEGHGGVSRTFRVCKLSGFTVLPCSEVYGIRFHSLRCHGGLRVSRIVGLELARSML